MTGFASVTVGDLAVTVKSVNNKGLDLHFHLPAVFEGAEPSLRGVVKEYCARGSVQVRAAWNSPRQTGLNRELLHSWLATFREAALELNLDAVPDLNAALRLPGMFEGGQTPEEIPDLMPLLRLALVEWNTFRDREGAVLTAELLARTRSLESIAGEIELLREGASAAFHQRLSARLAEFLTGAVDPQRLAVEAALLTEKSDVSEELVRLRAHAAQLAVLVQSEGEVAKRIDFLLQEMNRETNTILSKTGGLGEIGLRITNLALGAKSEIDKIREQALNLE
jgi:uncharacterized protein (TIGR00255 family)